MAAVTFATVPSGTPGAPFMTSADQTFYGSDFGQLQSQDPEIAGVLLVASSTGCGAVCS